MTAGTQIRDFIEVGEVARQFVRALAMEGVEPGRPRIHHVATGQARTLRDFAEEWWKKWGARGKLLVGALPQRTGEIPRYVPDAAALLPP
jgi:nucleoside-diphosphate-sugar epimerase